jgi:hypothetical protein
MPEHVIAQRIERWPIVRNAERAAWVAMGDRRRLELRAVGKLVHLQGNERPYFSLTGDVVVSPDTQREDIIAGGAMGDEIARRHPAWAVVAKVHLADDRGWPMHAVANAMHWAGLTGRFEGTPPARPAEVCRCCEQMRPARPAVEGVWTPWEPWVDSDERVAKLARHLRVDLDEAREIRRYVVDAGGMESEGMRFALRDLEARWAADAAAALAFLRAGDTREA